MSSTILKIISIKPDYVPTAFNRDKAKKYLESIFKKTDIELIQMKDIEFVDQGSNFDSVSCNFCGHKIDMDVWQETMDKAEKSKFANRLFTTPCCKKQADLNNLKYTTPAGFGKFVISISDAPRDLSEKEIKELESLLDTKIRKVWAHY